MTPLLAHLPSAIFLPLLLFFFFFNPPAPTEIYTLSLHDALPICMSVPLRHGGDGIRLVVNRSWRVTFSGNWWNFHSNNQDRKSTRLNSSHEWIWYAVFCLKKKKNMTKTPNVYR